MLFYRLLHSLCKNRVFPFLFSRGHLVIAFCFYNETKIMSYLLEISCKVISNTLEIVEIYDI